MFLRRASRRLLASSLDDQSCEDSGEGAACCNGTSAAAALAAVAAATDAVLLVVVVAKRGSGFSFAGDGSGDDTAVAAAAAPTVCGDCWISLAAQLVESWFRGVTAGLADQISGRGIAVLVLPPSLSFLFPIILMAGFLTSKKSSALNPIIARQIISRILNRLARGSAR